MPSASTYDCKGRGDRTIHAETRGGLRVASHRRLNRAADDAARGGGRYAGMC